MRSIRDEAELPPTRRPPATTPQGRENQMISLAIDRAEQQLRDGTASAMVITHYLKLATSRERLEQEQLRRRNALLAAQAETLESAKRVEELYKEALTAMRSYQGVDEPEDYEYED